MNVVNGNGEYIDKIIPDGTLSSPGLQFAQESKTGIMREKYSGGTSMTFVKKGNKRIRITDTETDVIGPIVVDSVSPDYVILPEGSASDPHLQFIGHTQSGLYWSTTPGLSGVSVADNDLPVATFHGTDLSVKGNYDFLDSVAGMHQTAAGTMPPGVTGLILQADFSGEPRPQIRLYDDHAYFYNSINAESDVLTQASHGWVGSYSRIDQETKAGLQKRIRVYVQDGTGTSAATGMIIDTDRVYCGSDVSLTDLHCADISCIGITSTTLNSAFTTAGALSTTSIGNSGTLLTGPITTSSISSSSIINGGTLSSGAITSVGNISAGTNSMICGDITASNQSYIWLYNAGSIQSITSGTNTPLTFWTVQSNVGSAFTFSANPNVTLNKTGRYEISAGVFWASGDTTARAIFINHSATTVHLAWNQKTNSLTEVISTNTNDIINATAGDTVNIQVYQDGTGVKNCNNFNTPFIPCYWKMTFLG